MLLLRSWQEQEPCGCVCAGKRGATGSCSSLGMLLGGIYVRGWKCSNPAVSSFLHKHSHTWHSSPPWRIDLGTHCSKRRLVFLPLRWQKLNETFLFQRVVFFVLFCPFLFGFGFAPCIPVPSPTSSPAAAWVAPGFRRAPRPGFTRNKTSNPGIQAPCKN